jgi:hypothetical protein
MKPRESFAMLLRAIAVWEFVHGVELLPSWVSIFFNEAAFHPPSMFWGGALSQSGLNIIVGLLLFFIAPWFARMVYPDPEGVGDAR